MTGGYVGADVAQLRALGLRIDSAADEIERASRVVSECLTTTTQWRGPDAAQFRGVWAGSHRQQVNAAVAALRAASRALRRNADEQQRASAVDGGLSPELWAVPGTVGGAAGAISRPFTRSGDGVPHPPMSNDPKEAASWWAGLSDRQRDQVISKHPEWIGNRDGIPAWARHKANTSLIGRYRSELEAERDKLRIAMLVGAGGMIAGGLPIGSAGGAVTAGIGAKLLFVEGKLDALDAIEKTLELEDRQLLLLDITGARQVKAAVAVGNLDTADHVAVYTPGFTGTVQGGLSGADREMAALRTLAAAESQKYGGGGSVAAIAWFGYEAPQWNGVGVPSHSVLNAGLAEAGAKDLAEFYRGINASRDSDPRLTAIGHSYGSTTTGIAVQEEGTGVDAVVVLGSPGIGTSDVADLKVPRGQVYAIESRFDPVADSGQFGGDPSRMSGITNLSARDHLVDGRQLTGSGGDLWHTEYLENRTTSQHNIASVIAGVPERAVRD